MITTFFSKLTRIIRLEQDLQFGKDIIATLRDVMIFCWERSALLALQSPPRPSRATPLLKPADLQDQRDRGKLVSW